MHCFYLGVYLIGHYPTFHADHQRQVKKKPWHMRSIRVKKELLILLYCTWAVTQN